MPRAIDPSLPGGGLPITHSPLNRMRTSVVPPEFDLEEFLEQVAAGWTKALQDFILPAIEDLTGLDLSSWDAFLASLLSGTGIDLTALTAEAMAFLADLQVAFEGLDFSSPIAFYNSFVTQLGELLGIDLTGLLYVGDPINADWLYNLIPTDLMAQVSISNIGTALTNLITDPTFTDAANFTGGGVYEYDATEGHAGLGCARTVADGTGSKDLLSNLIPVSDGQVLPISGWAKWSGLSAAVGSFPVQLNVTGYVTGSDVTRQATIAARSATPPTTDWTYLSGSYTVPADVSSLRVRLTVAPAATAGTVWWDDLSATKTGPLLQRLIAGTDPGSLLPDDIGNLFNGIITNALELLNKAGLTDFNELVSTIAGDIGDDITAAGQRLNTFLDSLSPLDAGNINTGNIADQFVPGISTILQNMFTNLMRSTNQSGVYTHDDAAQALAQTSFAAVDTSARLAQLENTFTGGVSDGDDFERTSSSSLGPGWLTFYSGGAGIWATPNGHDASFATSGIADRDFLCIRNTGQIRSATELQRQVLVMGSAATRFWLPGLYNYCGHNDIWLRISDATTSLANVTGIRIRWGGDGSMSICRFVNGVNLDAATALAYLPPDTLTPPGPGSSPWAEAGAPGILRYFRAGIGTSTLLEATEVGTASGAGAAFKRWGHGGRAEGSTLPLPGQQRPGAVHQETRKDQLT